MLSELYFRVGPMEGFTGSDLADKKEGYTNPIRELLQNALDASHEAHNNECKVNIYIETILAKQIPHIEEYKEVLHKAIATAEKQGSYNENSKQRVALIEEALQKEKLKVLLFADDGIGMKQNRLDAILTGGVSIKGDEKSGGSFGVGNLSSYSLSSLRYVLYATKYKDNGTPKTLYTGSPILAGHQDGKTQRSHRGRIVKEKPKYETNPKFTYLNDPPDFIEPKMHEFDTGTVVAILGLSEDWSDDAEYAIVSNFFHAIAHDRLSITIHKDGDAKEISDNRVEQLIGGKKEVKKARGDNILSGKMVFQAWQTLQEQGSQKIIALSNSDKVHVCIKSDKNTNSAIILVRNGMVVARHDSMLSVDIDKLRKDPDFEPFTAIIDIDKQDAPKLFWLVKNAEGPYHNRLQKGGLIKKDEKELKKLLKELSEKMKADYLKKIERDSFDLPLFTVPSEAQENVSSVKKSDGQGEEASPKPELTRPPKIKKEQASIEGSGHALPIVISRLLESKTAVRYIDNDSKWQVRLRITPTQQENAKDDAYLSIGLGEDSDKEQRTYLNFITAELNGTAIEVSDDSKKQIKLGSLSKDTKYDLIAEIEKPNDIRNMKVALSPMLGLRQRKKSKRPR